MTDHAPRGIRLNNPGNIRHGKDKWAGKSAEQPDPSFIKFDTMQHGVRAIARILISYDKCGVNTVATIVARWAPPSENDTEAYIENVASWVNVDPAEVLDIDNCDVMLPLIRAIVRQENGLAAAAGLKDKVILEGMRMAGVHGVKPKGLAERGGFKTQAVATAASGLGLAATVAEPVKKAADGLEPFSGSPIISQVVIGLLTIAGAATLAGVVGTWLKARKGL